MISASLLWVIIGGLLEPVWVIGLKKLADAERNYRWFWFVFTAVFVYLSPMCVGMAMKDMQMGSAYAVWTGLGSIFAMIAGFLLFKERVDRVKVGLVALIIIGVIGLEASTGVSI